MTHDQHIPKGPSLLFHATLQQMPKYKMQDQQINEQHWSAEPSAQARW